MDFTDFCALDYTGAARNKFRAAVDAVGAVARLAIRKIPGRNRSG